MRLDTKAIRGRAEAATPGPWRAGSRETWLVFRDIGNPDHMAPALGRVVAHVNQHFPYAADANFIAAARTDVPALCDRVEALEAALRKSLPCDSGAPDDARCGSCVACVDLARALRGEP